jgi:hypothetical protein
MHASEARRLLLFTIGVANSRAQEMRYAATKKEVENLKSAFVAWEAKLLAGGLALSTDINAYVIAFSCLRNSFRFSVLR